MHEIHFIYSFGETKNQMETKDNQNLPEETSQAELDFIQFQINRIHPRSHVENLSDGFHTFAELYEARCVLTAALFNLMEKQYIGLVCKSWRHFDGELCFGGGWFIVQAILPDGQISFHYPAKDWDRFSIPERETAWEWDGHTTQDVYDRLLSI